MADQPEKPLQNPPPWVLVPEPIDDPAELESLDKVLRLVGRGDGASEMRGSIPAKGLVLATVEAPTEMVGPERKSARLVHAPPRFWWLASAGLAAAALLIGLLIGRFFS